MRLLSPCGSQITITPVAGTLGSDTGEPEMLHWVYDDERGRMYVTMPDDQ